MEEKIRCEICNRNFNNEEALAMHNKAKHPENVLKEKKPLPIRKIKNLGIFLLIVVLISAGIIWWTSSIEIFPPTDIKGHVESKPASHVLKKPMPITIQKHMLEHADGIEKGQGGVIINYNCEDYSCESDLIEKLEAFAIKYDYVYVAPFERMDAKIALTKLKKIEILDEYNNETIEKFINY